MEPNKKIIKQLNSPSYVSVRHQLLEKAMEFFWIPEDIKNLISTYFKPTYVRFSNNKYSTNRQKLNFGIMMGCFISPLLFLLVMDQITSPSMKALMDDVTLIAESSTHMEQQVTRLQEIFKWGAMKIKPSKSRSLSLLNGNCKEIKFSVDGDEIPTICEKSVNSLSRCYSLPLTDRHCWQDLKNSYKMDYTQLINVTSWTKTKYGAFILGWFLN